MSDPSVARPPAGPRESIRRAGRALAASGLGCLLALAAACGAPPPAATPAATGSIATALLPPDPPAPTAVTVPADATQITLRLGGALGDADQLTAELTPVATPDEARRWPVDAAPEAGDGARASVTLPPYALAPGDYTLTVWEGDATVVEKYAFRVPR